jgi:phage shock protein PspC (stress-responsive transcriptional regulator)
MTSPLSCTDAVEGLRAMLAGSAEPDPDIVEHWRSCPRCAEILRKALRGMEALEAEPEPPGTDEALVTKVQKEVLARNWLRTLSLAFFAFLVVLVCCATLLVAAVVPGMAILLGSILLPLTLLVIILRVKRQPQGWKLYRRLGKGRQLGGVCLGLAERTGTRADTWRIVLVVAFFLGLPAFQLYVLMLLLMPVHPDDREYLLRFKLRRWWARFRRSPEPQAASR